MIKGFKVIKLIKVININVFNNIIISKEINCNYIMIVITEWYNQDDWEKFCWLNIFDQSFFLIMIKNVFFKMIILINKIFLNKTTFDHDQKKIWLNKYFDHAQKNIGDEIFLIQKIILIMIKKIIWLNKYFDHDQKNSGDEIFLIIIKNIFWSKKSCWSWSKYIFE